MARQALLFSAFLLFLNISLVLCRDDYNQYFSNHFSHHHRKSTPQDGIVESSGKQHGVHSTEDAVSLDAESSSPGVPNIAAVKTAGENNGQQHSYEYGRRNNLRDSYRTAQTTQIVSIVISIVGVIIGLIIIFCCGKNIGRRVRTGYVVGGATVGVQPPQPGFQVPQY